MLTGGLKEPVLSPRAIFYHIGLLNKGRLMVVYQLLFF